MQYIRLVSYYVKKWLKICQTIDHNFTPKSILFTSFVDYITITNDENSKLYSVFSVIKPHMANFDQHLLNF